MPKEKNKNMKMMTPEWIDDVTSRILNPGAENTRNQFYEMYEFFNAYKDRGMLDDEPNKRREIETIANGFLSLRNAQSRDDVKTGLQQISGLKDLLGSDYDELREMTDTSRFYRSLNFLETTLQVDLEIAGKRDRNYQPAWRVTETAEASPWEAYARQQLAKNPKTENERLDILANAMVGKFMHALPVLNSEPGTEPEPEEPFSESKARKYAKQFKANPAFKRYFKNQENVNKHLANPDRLASTCANILNPFANVDTKKARAILEKVQSSLGTMTGGNKEKEWTAVKESLNAIDLTDPDSYGRQMQSIFDAASQYMKGRKSLRSSALAQEKFDFAMRTVAELSEAGEFALNAAQTLMDRTNEVRMGHDRSYKPQTLDQYKKPDDVQALGDAEANREQSKKEAWENTFI